MAALRSGRAALRSLLAGTSIALLAVGGCGEGRSSPAARFCAGDGGAPAPSRARAFYDAISSPASRPLAPQRYPGQCLADRIDRLAAPRDAYCEARRAAGHDAMADEVWAFRQAFEKVARECEREAADRFTLRVQEGPVPCSALRSLLRDSLSVLAANHSPEELACLEEAIPEVSERLRQQCPAEGLSHEAAVEAMNAFAHRCRR